MKYIVLSTGSGWAQDYVGLVDGFVVELIDESNHTVDFEGPSVALTGPTPAYINALGSTRVSVTVSALEATGLTAGIHWWVGVCCMFGCMTERGSMLHTQRSPPCVVGRDQATHPPPPP